VANLPLRPPVVLARSVATLDRLSGGRVELGLGAGAFWDAIVAAGGPRRTPGESIEALEEAVAVIRAVWAGEGSVRLEGTHYAVKGLHAGPTPAHDVGIWIGAYRPRMLRLTGRVADGWLPSMGYADPPALREMNATIDEAARGAGRDPGAIRRLYNIGRGVSPEQLAELALENGMSTFITAVDTVAEVERFAAETAPATRELVEAARARRSGGPSAAGPVPSGERAAATRHTVPEEGTHPLVVTATPDDGARLTGRLGWDEATRPTVAADPGARFTLEQQATAQHLVDIHDGLRADLERLRDVIVQVATGEEQAHRARNLVNELTLRQNNWTLGAYCAQYCRFVTGHHTLEDRSVFPHLRRADPALGPVLDRLEEEHRVIHEVLEGVDRALVELVAGTAGTDVAQRAVDLLTDTLLSHLAYEERELIEPLARFGFA
jgi:alkanesulfonate monooxygenase SsuD/methylene tetrahydromethanopterin reductase-like flavin-dependent oxidoreductase (luciferase family)